MSRAFLKEDQLDGPDSDLPQRMASDLPVYLTPAGRELLANRVAALQAERAAASALSDESLRKQQLARIDRDLVFYMDRLERAICVDPADLPADEVHFGSIVTVLDPTGQQQCWTLVGEDEADIAAGRINFASPLARALMGAQVGDVVSWQRPDGEVELEILTID